MPDLLIKRSALTESLELGSQTRVGISSGIAHEFNALKPNEVKAQLDRVCLALHLLWLELFPNADPNENPYPDPMVARVMKVTQVF